MIRAQEALKYFVSLLPKTEKVLNIGDKSRSEANKFILSSGLASDTISLDQKADFIGDYVSIGLSKYNAVWCSHCLEHQRNPGLFLDKIFADLENDGLLGITVPKAKEYLAGGHVTIWNETVLLYQLILSEFDCRKAEVIKHGYDISVIVKKKRIELKSLHFDRRDKPIIQDYMPVSMVTKSRGE